MLNNQCTLCQGKPMKTNITRIYQRMKQSVNKYYFRNTLTEVACLYMQILSFNKNNFKIFRHIGNPNIGSSEGKQSWFSGFISNLCKNLVRKRKSSILARDSPKHDLFPMKINQPENFHHLIL